MYKLTHSSGTDTANTCHLATLQSTLIKRGNAQTPAYPYPTAMAAATKPHPVPKTKALPAETTGTKCLDYNG